MMNPQTRCIVMCAGNFLLLGDSSNLHASCMSMREARENPGKASVSLAIWYVESEMREKMSKLFNNAYFVAKEEFPFAKIFKLCI